MAARHDQGMAAGGGVDVHEGHRPLVLADVFAGSSPATIWQNRQSGSLMRAASGSAIGRRRRSRRQRSAELAGGRARSPPRARHLPGERRLLELAQQLAQLGPGRDAQRPDQLVAAHRRPGGSRATPGPRRASAGPARGARRSPARSCPPRVASRSATLSRVTSTCDRVEFVQVAVDRAAAERHLVDQETQPQVVAGQRRHVLAQPVAGPQPLRIAAAVLGPGLVVAHERDPPLGGDTSRVWGLAMSCSRAPKRSASPRVSSLASGRRAAPDGLGASRAERPAPGRAPAPSPRRARRACGHTRRGGESGSAPPRAAPRARAGSPSVTPSSSISSSPSEGPVARSRIRCSSAKIRSARRAGQPGGAARASSTVLGLDRETELAGQAGQPQRPQRVPLRSLRRTRSAAAARAGRPAPPNGSTSSSAPQSGWAIALTVRSRRARSASIVRRRAASGPPASPVVPAGDHPPGPKAVRELEREAAGRPAPASRATRATAPVTATS